MIPESLNGGTPHFHIFASHFVARDIPGSLVTHRLVKRALAGDCDSSSYLPSATLSRQCPSLFRSHSRFAQSIASR
jgi:hypothetical protein